MKQIKHTIGGEERTLVFGLTGFYDHIKTAINGEPFEYLSKFKEKDATITRDDMVVFFHASLNSAIDLNGGENIPFEKVKQMYRTIPLDEIEGFHAEILKGIAGDNIDEPGEANSQPEKGSD